MHQACPMCSVTKSSHALCFQQPGTAGLTQPRPVRAWWFMQVHNGFGFEK